MVYINLWFYEVPIYKVQKVGTRKLILYLLLKIILYLLWQTKRTDKDIHILCVIYSGVALTLI